MNFLVPSPRETEPYNKHWYYTFRNDVTLVCTCYIRTALFSANLKRVLLTTFSWKKKIADGHCAWVLCWEAINHSPVYDFIKKPSIFQHRASAIKLCTLYEGLQWFQKLTQPDDSTVYYTYKTMWQIQRNLSWIVIPSDFVVVTCFTRVPFITIEGEATMVYSLWPHPISINSVLVIFRVSLFAFNQVCTFNSQVCTFNSLSSLRHDSMLPTLLSAYARYV